MKFRQRTFVAVIIGLTLVTWFTRFFFFRSVNLQSAVELFNTCWPRVYYPRRDDTSLHLYSVVNRTFGSLSVYSPEGEGRFDFINDLPRHRETPMQIFIIPHSHNDPAWIKTFDSYYFDQTKPILDNIVKYLDKYRDMTFLWTEPIFLDRYFKSMNSQNRSLFMNFIKEGRLEIAAGGWISPDEATTTNYALISQMAEGLWWLKSHLNYTCETYWNIDPFGYSQSVPYFLRKANFRHVNMVRVNEKLKQLLRQSRRLEFQWSAFWERETKGIFTSILPFMLYNIKYSCGPSTAACLMFDFRQINGESSESTAVTVDSTNVERIAEQLVEQLDLKSRMYRHNVLIFPIGDDFRFDHELEWSQVYLNFKRLFEFMNAKKAWNLKIRFGTLRDYYREVSKRVPTESLTTLEGDFYPYTDRNEDYWTGYFTSRPLLKRRVRKAEKWIRAAEIFTGLVYLRDGENQNTKGLENNLSRIRRDFAFLQHHDAIAGTSKPFVMDTYYENIDRIFSFSANLIEKSMYSLTGRSMHVSSNDFENDPLFDGKEKTLTLVNSREELSYECFHIESKEFKVSVKSEDGDAIRCQINPRVATELAYGLYEVVFCLNIQGLGLRRVRLSRSEPFCALATVWTGDKSRQKTAWSARDIADIDRIFAISSPHVGVILGADDGLPTSFTLSRSGSLPASPPISVTSAFAFYTGSSSGAYIFSPNSQMVDLMPMTVKQLWLYDGPIEGGAAVEGMWRYNVRLVKDRKSPLSRGILLQSNFTPSVLPLNAEIIFRMTVNGLNSGTDFFTDSNGMALMRRRRQSSLPVQANYYPATNAVVLEDRMKRLRLNLLLSQSVGSTSVASGSAEVMLMRQPGQDDFRGLGEGVEEMDPVPADVMIVLEACAKLQQCDSVPGGASTKSTRDQPSGEFLSKSAASIERLLNRPALVFSNATVTRPESETTSGHRWEGLSILTRAEFHVVNFRRLPIAGQLLLVINKPGKSLCHQSDEPYPLKPEGTRLYEFVKQFLGPLFYRVEAIHLSDLNGLERSRELRVGGEWSDMRLAVNDLISLVLTLAS